MSLTVKSPHALELFYSYTRKDEQWLKRLEGHLSGLRRQGFIVGWHRCEINAGLDWRSEALAHLNTAQIILLLVSPDFLDSEYCQSVEMMRAIERHRTGDARIIPIILRPCDWQGTIIEELQVLPTSGKEITLWSNSDNALLQVAKGIRRVVDEFRALNSIACAPDSIEHRGTGQDTDTQKIEKRSSLVQLFERERNRQERNALFTQQPVKIDKDIIVSYDLDTQMREFSKRLNFGGVYAFAISGQSNVLRDYIIERMCKELKNKMGRNHRKIDISLLREDAIEDKQYLMQQKIIFKYGYNTIIDLFKEDPSMDIVLTVWNHFFPLETTREVAEFFWSYVATYIAPFLDITGQCFVVVLANVGEKMIIEQLDHFTLLPIPERFDIGHLTQWMSGWLKGRGVRSSDVESCINRLRDNHGHFLPTYQEIENIINDLKGRYDDS